MDLFGLAPWDCNCLADIGNKKLLAAAFRILQGALSTQRENLTGANKPGTIAQIIVKFGLNQILKAQGDTLGVGKSVNSVFSTTVMGYRSSFKLTYVKCVSDGGNGVKWSDEIESEKLVDSVDISGSFYFESPEKALEAAWVVASQTWNSLD